MEEIEIYINSNSGGRNDQRLTFTDFTKIIAPLSLDFQELFFER